MKTRSSRGIIISLLIILLLTAFMFSSCTPIKIVINDNNSAGGSGSDSGSDTADNAVSSDSGEPAATQAKAPEKPQLKSVDETCELCEGNGYTVCGICNGTGVYKTTSVHIGPPPSYLPYNVEEEYPCYYYGCKNGHVECILCHGVGYFTKYYTPDGKQVTPETFDRAWTQYMTYYNQGYVDADLNVIYDMIVYNDMAAMFGDIGSYTPTLPAVDTGDKNSAAAITCKTCNGRGKKTCTSCHGSRTLSSTKYTPDYYGTGNNDYSVDKKCPACNGTGETFCTSCMGKGYY